MACSLHPGAYSTHTTNPQPYNVHLSWHSLLLEGAVHPNQEHVLHGVLVFHASLPQWVLMLSVCSRCSHRCWMKVRMPDAASVNSVSLCFSANNEIISVILINHRLFISF